MAPRANRPIIPDQILAIYQDAVDNLRFVKQQQWRVTNYALLVYAAVYFLRDQEPMDTCGGKAALTVMYRAGLRYSACSCFASLRAA